MHNKLIELPAFDYLLDVFPNQGSKNQKYIFENFLRPEEQLYLGPVPTHALKFIEEPALLKIPKNYFSKNLQHVIYNSEDTSIENTEAKDFTKLCWLTNEFFTKGFKTYFGGHYNPRIQQNVIHPGGGRQIIHNLFDTADTIYMFYFNTMGQQFDWLKNCKSLTYDQLVELGYSITFVADHTSFIPHVYWTKDMSVPTTTEGVNQYAPILKETLSTYSIYTNIKLPMYLESFTATKKTASVIIKFSNSNRIEVLKALLLSINRLPAIDQSFTIKYVQ
jgi:hypothetical protein